MSFLFLYMYIYIYIQLQLWILLINTAKDNNEARVCTSNPCETKAQTSVCFWSSVSFFFYFFYSCFYMSVYEYPQYCLLRQLLLWAQQSYPPAVQIFCSRGTANQKEAGLKGKGGKKSQGATPRPTMRWTRITLNCESFSVSYSFTFKKIYRVGNEHNRFL